MRHEHASYLHEEQPTDPVDRCGLGLALEPSPSLDASMGTDLYGGNGVG